MTIKPFTRAALAALILALTLAPAAAQAESKRNEALYGAGSALASLVYGPAKICYALGGSVVAGLAYLWSAGDSDVVQPILNASLRGDYVITPAQLRREEPIEFIGRRRDHDVRNVGSGPPIHGEVVAEEIYIEEF